jgi:cellulose synthase/poly-beta-1,6-N-acetylglucosamine synthase-like glycosyltransferase
MPHFVPASLVFLAQPGLAQYVRRHFLDTTFKGLYEANAFDLALLIPYFVVLILLASYGIHRYTLVYLYYKKKQNATKPPQEFSSLPRVTVQLPIFNEQYVVDRLLQAVCRLEYPREKLDIQLLDDSTDETVNVARELVEHYASQGYPVTYLHRTNREGFKAGALHEGLKTATGEFVAIFDADFVPPSDFLLKTIHHFTDPKIGMVQTRWTHINRNYSFGGWEHDTLTEDTDLSYRAQLKGWKFIYRQDIECPAELPVEMTAFKTQQARWAKGLIQTGKKILPKVLKSDQPFRVKLEAWYHLTANMSYPLMVILSVLLLPAMVIRFYQGWFQMLYIDIPLFLASTFSISSFYLVSQRELFPRTWPRALLYLPFLMALGIGLTLTNTLAVLEALIGKKSAFARTPKYRVETKKDVVRGTKYRKRLGWVPWVELLIGSYFALTVYYALDNENYFTVPFLLLFVIGYWYTGLMSLLQGRFSSLSLSTGSHTKPYPVGV